MKMNEPNLFQWSETSEAVKKLHLLLKCRVCDALPVDPVVLPECHHTFCAACLRERPSCSSSDPRECPLCGTTAPHLPSSTHPDDLTVWLCDALQDLQSLLTSSNHLPRKTVVLEGRPAPGEMSRVHYFKSEVICHSSGKSKRTGGSPAEGRAAPGPSRPSVPFACGGEIPSALTAADVKLIVPKSNPTKPQLKPPASQLKPATTQPKPATPQSKSATTQPKPVTPQTKSATIQLKPATPQIKSATIQLKPATPQSKSATIQPKPATPQIKSATIQQKPATPQTKSATTQLKPATPQIKSATIQLKPVTPQTKSATIPPKPATPQSRPAAQGVSPLPRKRGAVSLHNPPTTPEASTACPKSLPETPKLDRRNLKGETALHAACVKGDEQLVRRLLREGANPNCRDHAGWTPLHEACQHGHVAIAEELLLAGALPSVPGYEGNATPLHDAVEHGRDEVIRTLRRHGARDDVRNMYGNTARDLASLCRAPGALLAALDTPPDLELMRQVRRAEPPQHSVVVTGSNLTGDQAKLLQTFARLFRIRVVADYCPEVSHVVVSCEEKRLVCLRTAKFMMGVVAGKWIVSHAWVQACVQQKSLVSAEAFEVSGSSQNAASCAPTLARLNSNCMLPGLFSGCHIYLHGHFRSDNCPSKRDLEGLVRAGGGRLLLREPKPENIPALEKTVPYHASSESCLASCSHYIIYLEGSDTEPKLKYDMAHIKSLPLSWLIDCVDHFKLLPPFHSVK